MTPNKRIFLNIVATYGRSLYALVIGLFCGRWTLMVLGEVDYGLMGVVGGLTAFIGFINGIMAAGVGRFYAVSVGESRMDPVHGVEKCREWFSTAVLVHTVLPIVLIAIGYPTGDWAVRHFLSIPSERVVACIWVWRFTCLSCLVGMVSVPYHAMYGAKQEIAELTIYSFVTTTLNVIVLYFMVTHPDDWLSRYSLWTCCLGVIPSLIITVRAFIKYPECRFRMEYAKDISRVLRMFKYSGWFLIGDTAALLRGQGITILVNKFFGARVNAAQAIGNTVASQCTTLSGSLIGAFSPAIANAYGEGRYDVVCEYAYRVSRIATVLILVFAIPLGVEVNEVMRLWLKNPPNYAAGLCLCALISDVIDKTSFGYAIAAHACENIAKYQKWVGGVNLVSLPLALVVAYCGGDVYWIASVVILMNLAVATTRVYLSRQMLPLSAKYWIRKILFPIICVVSLSVVLGIVPSLFFEPSFARVCVTGLVVESVFLPLAWRFLLTTDERHFVLNRITSILEKFNG